MAQGLEHTGSLSDAQQSDLIPVGTSQEPTSVCRRSRFNLVRLRLVWFETQDSGCGKGQIRDVKIDPGIVQDGDVEMLEDLVTAAVTDAQRRAEEIYKDELRKVTGGLPLPFQLPL